MEKQAIHPYPATQPCKGVNVFVPHGENFKKAMDGIRQGLKSVGILEADEALEDAAAGWTADSAAFPAIGGSVDSAANPE